MGNAMEPKYSWGPCASKGWSRLRFQSWSNAHCQVLTPQCVCPFACELCKIFSLNSQHTSCAFFLSPRSRHAWPLWGQRVNGFCFACIMCIHTLALCCPLMLVIFTGESSGQITAAEICSSCHINDPCLSKTRVEK